MLRHARMILLAAGALLGGPALMAQGLPNPLHLPDPLGITDSSKGKKDAPQPLQRGKHRGNRGWHRGERHDHDHDHDHDHQGDHHKH